MRLPIFRCIQTCFVGAVAPIAWVGSVRVEVVNNTIWKPEKWVMRILQETVDPDRFLSCGDNLFRNNIVVIDGQVSREVNIGPNTRPESFRMSNNLWYHAENAAWSGPDLPVRDDDAVIGENPMLANPDMEDVAIGPNSPAVGNGYSVSQPTLDIAGEPFNNPRSIGAFEGNPPTTSVQLEERVLNKAPNPEIRIVPNPAHDGCVLHYHLNNAANVVLETFDSNGKLIERVVEGYQEAGSHQQRIEARESGGMILLLLTINGRAYSTQITSLNGTDR